MINYIKNKGSPLFFFIFNLPLIQFFHENNLKQVLSYELIVIFFYHFLFFISFFISVFFIYYLFKKKISKKVFFYTSFIFYYLIFFYYFIKNEILNISSNYINIGIFLDIIIIIFYILFFIYFLNILKKEKFFNIFRIFLIIFLSLNYLLFLKDITKIYSNNDKNIQNLASNEDQVKLNKANIYYIIFDGMISLESAEKNNLIKDKKKVIKNFNEKKASYLENSISNYSTSYLSISSILQADYPVIENDKKYKNRFNFFPYNLTNSNNEMFLLDVLKKVKKNFIWIGNSWAPCQDNNKKYSIKCIDSKSNNIQILLKFYSTTPFKKILYLAFYNPQDVKFLSNTENFLDTIITENNFYLIHLLIPHDAILNDECVVNKKEKKITNKKNYKIQYNCSINKISEILDLINKKDKNEKLIIISSDHGWSFLKSNDFDNKKYNQERSEIFNLIQAPDRCKQKDLNIKIKSPINNIRFALNCIHHMNLPYLTNKHFIGFYESSKKYGEVIELR